MANEARNLCITGPVQTKADAAVLIAAISNARDTLHIARDTAGTQNNLTTLEALRRIDRELEAENRALRTSAKRGQ